MTTSIEPKKLRHVSAHTSAVLEIFIKGDQNLVAKHKKTVCIGEIKAHYKAILQDDVASFHEPQIQL